MKTTNKILMAILIIASSLTFSKKAVACIDTTSIITVNCEYDSNFTNIRLRISNMQLFGSPSGAFCTCGISKFTDIFNDILYISFIDDLTGLPLSGFEEWTPNSSTSSAWVQAASGNWDGFLAETIGAGLQTGQNVSLIIRATIPFGFYLSINNLDSSLSLERIGTDEYNINANNLAFSHTNNVGLADNPSSSINYIWKPLSHFSNIDSIYNSFFVCNASFTTAVDSNGAITFLNTSTGTDSSTTYLWDFGDSTSSTLENPSHTYTTGGSYLICLTIFVPSDSCTSVFCDSIFVAGSTSITENNSSISELKTYPNPFNETVFIELTLTKNTNVETYVTDLLGTTVGVINNELMPSGLHKLQWNAHNLANGIYLLNIKTGNDFQVKKLVLNK